MVTLTNQLGIALGSWHFGDFRNIFLPNIGEDLKKTYHLSAGPFGTVPYRNSGPGYCITLTKTLDESLRLQVLGQTSLILPEEYIYIGWQKLNSGVRGPGLQCYW